MKNQKKVSRRELLAALTGIITVSAAAKNSKSNADINQEDQYEILLKPDGSTVKVKKQTVTEANVIQRKVSNSSMLNWLKKSNK